MNLKDNYQKLINSTSFKAFKEAQPQAYLSHFFAKLDKDMNSQDVEVGFYNEQTGKITVFALGETVEKKMEDEPFRKEGHPQHLDLKKVKTSWEEAKKTVRKLQEEIYSAQIPANGFLILQNIQGATLWNVTLMTLTFSALNVKVDALSGEIVKHELTSFFDLRK